MPRLFSEDPENQFRRMRQSGRARLPTDPYRAAMDRRELLRRGTTGSLEADVRDFEYRRSEGRELLSGRGFRGLSERNLSTGGPEAIEKINQMHRQRTGQSMGGGMGNAQVAWPKLRDPFEQFREKAWWFLKEGDFSQSLKKIREWSFACGTLIHTMSGTEEIQNIKVGEKVLTHKGRYRTVLATSSREDDTTLWTVKPHYVPEFAATEGHKMWVLRDGKEQWLPIQELTTNDHLFVPVDKTVVDKDSVSVWETLDRDEWIVAEANHVERKPVTKDSLSCLGEGPVVEKATNLGRPRGKIEGSCNSPVIARGLCQLHYSRRKADGTLPDVSTPSGFASEGSLADEMFGRKVKDLIQEEFNAYSLEVYHRRHGKDLIEGGLVEEGSILRRNQKNANYSPMPVEFEVDEDLLWLFGMFVAEGSTAEGKKVHWDLNRKEIEYAERIKKVLDVKFGVEAHVREKQNSKGQWLVVESSSVPLNAWFRQMLGVTSYHKHFPEWALTLPPEKAAWLLRGYFDGDGHYGNGRYITATTTSRVLAEQVQRLIQRAGFLVHVNVVEPKDNHSRHWTIGPASANSREFGRSLGIDVQDIERPQGLKYGHLIDNGQWVQIHRISSAPYKGMVYDLTVEEDFSFVTSVAAHNCRLVYMTHPLIPSLIDIYSRFPLLDIEFKHQDQKLADFYNELFLNQLDYQEFLFDKAREHWTVGESFALGSWHDGIGAWDADELLNPDDVIVSRNSVLRQYQFHLKVPEGIKKLIETRQPREEYEMLVRFYPYILQWAQQNSEIPVSDVLLKQSKFKVNPWEPHGVPILMRAFKTMMLEMSLEAAQDAVADRLYSPLILANLGIEDIGDGEGPWIPEPEEIDALRDDLALSLMSDFRLMVYHHGLSIQSVFGREVMPRFDMDFERVDMKLMQIFGIGPELLQGGKASAPYASGALNRELVTQMLSTYQVNEKKFLRERMEVVAERQGHYEFEKRGTQRFPVFETVLMQDELTGEEYVEEKPKLAIPEVSFRTMNLRDETVERQFLIELKQAGIPVADSSFMINVAIDFDDEVTRIQREKMDKVLAELHYQKRLFTAIFINHLPVPPEYAMAYMEFVSGIQGMALMMGGTDITMNPPVPNLFPQLEPSSGDIENAMMATGAGEGGETRSAESDSMRGSTPRQASILYASDQVRAEYEELGEDGWIAKYAAEVDVVQQDASSKSGDSTSQDEEFPVASGYEDLINPVPETGLTEEQSIRVAGIKSMASPSFMEIRRKMVLPRGTRIKEASEEELAETARRLLEADFEDEHTDDGGDSDSDL